MQMKYFPPPSVRPPSLLRKAGAVVVTAALAGLALMFSAVLLVFLLCVGTVAFAYLWWKTRGVRKQMRNFPPPNGATAQSEVFQGRVYEGEIIEGEVVRAQKPRIGESAGAEAHKAAAKKDTP